MAANGKKKEDAAFKEYVSLMIDKKKFRPDEKSECRWHVESESGSGEYTTTVSGKSGFYTCNGFRVSTGKECKHIRLIRLISGLLGFAATRETVIGEITGARCPSCKKSDFHEYCERPTTRRATPSGTSGVRQPRPSPSGPCGRWESCTSPVRVEDVCSCPVRFTMPGPAKAATALRDRNGGAFFLRSGTGSTNDKQGCITRPPPAMPDLSRRPGAIGVRC